MFNHHSLLQQIHRLGPFFLSIIDFFDVRFLFSSRDLYPSEFLPLNIPIQAITGSADDVVPITQTMDFVQQAKNAGDNCSEVIVPGEDHFVHLNPTSQSWNRTRAFILSFIQ